MYLSAYNKVIIDWINYQGNPFVAFKLWIVSALRCITPCCWAGPALAATCALAERPKHCTTHPTAERPATGTHLDREVRERSRNPLKYEVISPLFCFGTVEVDYEIVAGKFTLRHTMGEYGWCCGPEGEFVMGVRGSMAETGKTTVKPLIWTGGMRGPVLIYGRSFQVWGFPLKR